MFAALVLVVVGVAAIVAPFVVPDATMVHRIAGLVFGSCLVGAGALVASIRLYRKTLAHEAFVRTGQGGEKAVLGGGAIVIPILHNVVPISLQTMKLGVQRNGPDALITADNLRVNVEAEFYIKVAPQEPDILAAARSLGEKGTHADSIAQLVGEKLVSALRSVAAQKQLVELHVEREKFATAVSEAVRGDLQHNGLTLEAVTISMLDQTDPRSLSDLNIFDAQGKRRIAEITQTALTERTQIEQAAEVQRNTLMREAERAKQSQDVETRKQILELERAKAEAEALQRTQVTNAQVEADREMKEFQIQQARQVQEAEIARQQQIALAEAHRDQEVKTAQVQQERAVEQASIERDQAIQVAAQERQRAVEVAERDRQITVAERDAARATAEAEALAAEAARQEAEQKVLTVQQTAEAEREAQKKFIATAKAAQEQRVREETQAGVRAFAVVAQAEGEQKAAEAQAAARLAQAKAAAEAAQMEASGERAKQMVPVEVEAERVEVERKRVEVLESELAARSKHEGVAVELEKFRILIQGQVEMAKAQSEAMGLALSEAKMTIWGDPDTVTQMAEGFHRGQSMGSLLQGVAKALPDDLKGLLDGVFDAVGNKLKPTTNGEATEDAPPSPDAEA